MHRRLYLQSRFQFLGGIGLLLYGLTATFASVDWMMSLEPHWFSTIYGLARDCRTGIKRICVCDCDYIHSNAVQTPFGCNDKHSLS